MTFQKHNSGFPGGSMGKNPPTMQEFGTNPLVGKIPWRRKYQPTPIFCLGNPMDRGAWQAKVMGPQKSQTRFSE